MYIFIRILSEFQFSATMNNNNHNIFVSIEIFNIFIIFNIYQIQGTHKNNFFDKLLDEKIGFKILKV